VCIEDVQMIYEVKVRKSEMRRRMLPALICGLVTIMSLATFAGPAGASGQCGGVTVSGQWTTIQGPRFSSGGSTITAHAVDTADPRILYATNGKVVSVSRDGGCSWRDSYAGKDLVSLAGDYTIKSMIAPVTQHVGLLIEQTTAGNPRPALEVTSNAGRTWSTQGVGLPPTGSPEFVRSAPSQPDLIYLGVDNGGGTLDTLFQSTDGGSTFTLKSDVSKAKPNAGITGLSVDPLDPQSLWAYGSGGLYHSTDGGASFSSIPEFANFDSGPVDVVHESGHPAIIIAFTNSRREYRVSRDGGKKWFRGDSPAAVDSVAHGIGAEDLVISANGRVYIRDASTFSWRNLNAPTQGVSAMVSNRSGSISYFGHTAHTLERYILPAGSGGGKHGGGDGLPGDPNISLPLPPELVAKASDLGPDGKKIILGPGKSRVVTYTLHLPQRPVPLDVYLLIDTSNSMYETLAGLRKSLIGIVGGLETRQVDAQFGLAEYRAYPYSCPPGQDPANFVYRQDQNIAPVSQALANKIAALTPDAGGFYDSHLGALYQTATGAGQDLFPVGVQNGDDVPPGQDAVWRDKALRVVINATDEVFGRETKQPGATGDLSNPECALEPTPSIPSFGQVISAFNDRNIKQVGLSIANSTESSYPDLARIAKGTGTLANVPVDCNGDGVIDLHAGSPLVCKLRPTGSQDGLNLVPAVLGLLDSVQKKVDVGLHVTHGDQVVDNVNPSLYPSVILQTAKALTYNVSFHCDKSQAGSSFSVDLAAASSLPLPRATADATVVCKKIPKAIVDKKKKKKKKKELPVPVLVPPLVPTVAAFAAAPPPPPPAPVSNLSSASQAQSQAQAQGATATQEQEEPQLALAQAYFEAQDDAEYAMTAYHGRKNYPPLGASLAMGVVAISLMGSGLVVLRRRTRDRYAYAGRRY
jgi:hypothetical protein